MKYKKKTMIESLRESIARRQNESYERFMQEKADVFQVTNTKEQAMFWKLPSLPPPLWPCGKLTARTFVEPLVTSIPSIRVRHSSSLHNK